MKAHMLMLLFFMSISVFAQEEKRESKAHREDAINVYIDASNYLKKEVSFINYVRDKEDADLLVIGTYQPTGSGGGEYTFFVEGQNEFVGVMDTVKFHTYPDESEEEVRAKGVRVFKIGLMKYIINTPLADFIDIQFTEKIEEEVNTDKWNNWVFTTGLQGALMGQKSVDAHSIGASFNAGMTSNEWRLSTGVNYNTSVTNYDYGDVTTTDQREDNRLYGDAVKSIGEHWAAGLSSDIFKSIYSNYDLGFVVGPAIEYDIFPYSESTRRIFRFFYILNYGYYDYADTTQFFKTKESLWSHRVQASYSTFQQWGSVNFSTEWSNYLHDFDLNRLSVYSRVSVKVAKGLTLNFNAGYAFIHDQVSLRKGDASMEDILLNRKEISTTYSYSSTIGITYRFGSIYNNIVNPRLDVLF